MKTATPKRTLNEAPTRWATGRPPHWRRGQVVVMRSRSAKEGPLDEFLASLPKRKPPLVRVPGRRRIPQPPSKDTTPLALHADADYANRLHEKVLIVSVDTVGLPHVELDDRFEVEQLGRGLFKVFHVTVRTGYHDATNVPELLKLCRKQGLLERNLDLEHAAYFVSQITITPASAPPLVTWRKKLFIAMNRNAASPVEHFDLPSDRTVIFGAQVAL